MQEPGIYQRANAESWKRRGSAGDGASICLNSLNGIWSGWTMALGRTFVRWWSVEYSMMENRVATRLEIERTETEELVSYVLEAVGC